MQTIKKSWKKIVSAITVIITILLAIFYGTNISTWNPPTPPVAVNIETLRPQSDGTYEEWYATESGTGDPTHYDSVDEVENTTTYLTSKEEEDCSAPDHTDTFNCNSTSFSAVDSVTFKMRAKSTSGTYKGTYKHVIYNGSATVNHDVSESSSWTVYAWEMSTDPFTGEAWTTANINNYEWGCNGKSGVECVYDNIGIQYDVRVSEVWVEVTEGIDYPPKYRNVGSNATLIPENGTNLLYAEGYDDIGLDSAWLWTNETGGSGMNYSSDTYYLRDNLPTHGQPQGNGDDVGTLLDSWEGTEYRNCSIYVIYFFDETDVPLKEWEITKIHWHIWWKAASGTEPLIGYQLNGTYGDAMDNSTVIGTGNGNYQLYNATWNVHIVPPNISASYYFAIKLDTNDLNGNPFIKTDSEHLSYITFTHSEYSNRYVNLNHVATTWTWTNITWTNNSITTGTIIQWRIYYEDTNGNINGTEIHSFAVRSTMIYNSNVTHEWNEIPLWSEDYGKNFSQVNASLWYDNVNYTYFAVYYSNSTALGYFEYGQDWNLDLVIPAEESNMEIHVWALCEGTWSHTYN